MAGASFIRQFSIRQWSISCDWCPWRANFPCVSIFRCFIAHRPGAQSVLDGPALPPPVGHRNERPRGTCPEQHTTGPQRHPFRGPQRPRVAVEGCMASVAAIAPDWGSQHALQARDGSGSLYEPDRAIAFCDECPRMITCAGSGMAPKQESSREDLRRRKHP